MLCCNNFSIRLQYLVVMVGGTNPLEQRQEFLWNTGIPCPLLINPNFSRMQNAHTGLLQLLGWLACMSATVGLCESRPGDINSSATSRLRSDASQRSRKGSATCHQCAEQLLQDKSHPGFHSRHFSGWFGFLKLYLLFEFCFSLWC